jgi:hypothetical protein
MSSLMEKSQSSQALAGLVALSTQTSLCASSKVSKGHVMFEYPESRQGSTAQQTLYSLKEAAARPRAYTEGDAYEIFQSFRRPRSNTLSDEDAVGALLSFSSVKGERSRSPSVDSHKMTSEKESEWGEGSTASYVPRARAMSDMSHAMLRLGKLDMDSSSESESSSSSSSSSGGDDSDSKEKGQFPNFRRKENIGIYSPVARRDRLRRFMQKRKKRIWQKRVKYDVRKNFADSRLRFKGRFVKKEDEELMRAAMEIC